MKRTYKPGEHVIYRVTKLSSSPGPRASDVTPEPRGEHYQYEVDKFWVVAQIPDEKHLVLKTRRGKEHLVDADDPRLRHARWWEWLRWRHKFPSLQPE